MSYVIIVKSEAMRFGCHDVRDVSRHLQDLLLRYEYDEIEIVPARADLDGMAADTACKRCGSLLKDKYCTSTQCPFDHHLQVCHRGWLGHPDEGRYQTHDCTCLIIPPKVRL